MGNKFLDKKHRWNKFVMSQWFDAEKEKKIIIGIYKLYVNF